MLNYVTKLYQLGALPVIRPGSTERIAVGAASAASTTAGGTIIRLVSTVDCYVAFGQAPTADPNCIFLPANTPEYFACGPADKVAVIRASTDGALFITPAI